MPRIIRRALFEKVAELPEWRRFREDFRALSGLELRLVDELGRAAESPEGTQSDSPMCGILAGCVEGKGYCERFRQRLLASGAEESSGMARAECDAGMMECAIPLQVAGQTVGYLVFCGFRANDEEMSHRLRRVRHLLARAGITPGEADLAAAYEQSPGLEPRQAEALARVVAMGAQVLGEHFAPAMDRASHGESALVRRARALIQRGALVEKVSLADVARRLRVSESHLSREFHRATGLTFGEYLTRLRARQAREMLIQTRKSISEIALDTGFGSISQFNRVFRRIYGKPPSALRKLEG
jgi:AraC-like DNA-binding protein